MQEFWNKFVINVNAGGQVKESLTCPPAWYPVILYGRCVQTGVCTELQLVQLCIYTVFSDQVFVTALLHDPAAGDYSDLVGILDGGDLVLL